MERERLLFLFFNPFLLSHLLGDILSDPAKTLPEGMDDTLRYHWLVYDQVNFEHLILFGIYIN